MGGKGSLCHPLSAMRIASHKHNSSQQGAILILVILITSLLAAVASSFQAGINDTMNTVRDEAGSLTAEFAVESGLEYAQRRLMIDPNWTGTGSEGWTLPDGKTRFIIEAHFDPDFQMDDGGDGDHPGDDDDGDHEDDDDDHHDGDHDGDCDHDDDDHHDGDHAEDDDDDDDHHDGDHDGDCDHDDDDHHDGDHADDCEDDDHHDGDHAEDDDDDSDHHDGDDDDADNDDDDGHHDGDDDDHEGDDDEDSGSSFNSAYVHTLEIAGIYGEAEAQLGSSVSVYTGDGGTSNLAFLFLGDNLQMQGGLIQGDAIVTDLPDRAEDWVIDTDGQGSFHTSSSNGVGSINFNGAGVDGTLYRYNEANNLQSLGKEVVIGDKAKTPAFSLDGFANEGSGKTLFQNTTSMQGLYLEDTAVVELQPGQHLVVDGCTLNGGLVVLLPNGTDLRQGPRNTIELLNNNTIGGGQSGAEQNIGILAPGCTLIVDSQGANIQGFTYLNQIDLAQQTTFEGQLVVLNRILSMTNCNVIYDQEVANNLPDSVSMEGAKGHTDVLTVFEDYN